MLYVTFFCFHSMMLAHICSYMVKEQILDFFFFFPSFNSAFSLWGEKYGKKKGKKKKKYKYY